MEDFERVKLIPIRDFQVFRNNKVDKSKDGNRTTLNLRFGDNHGCGVGVSSNIITDEGLDILQNALNELIKAYNDSLWNKDHTYNTHNITGINYFFCDKKAELTKGGSFFNYHFVDIPKSIWDKLGTEDYRLEFTGLSKKALRELRVDRIVHRFGMWFLVRFVEKSRKRVFLHNDEDVRDFVNSLREMYEKPPLSKTEYDIESDKLTVVLTKPVSKNKKGNPITLVVREEDEEKLTTATSLLIPYQFCTDNNKTNHKPHLYFKDPYTAGNVFSPGNYSTIKNEIPIGTKLCVLPSFYPPKLPQE
jgi:hypothetical protein